MQLWWDNGLKMQPIREILSCEEKMLLERTNCGIEELNHDLEKINSNRMYVKLTTDADEIVINTESAFLHETRKEKRFLDFVIRVIWLKLRERLQ